MDGKQRSQTHAFAQLPEEQVGERSFDEDLLKTYQKQFAMSNEEVDQVLRVLGDMGQEAVGSMGDDTPIPSYPLKSAW